MAFTVATRMKVGRLRHLPGFFYGTLLSALQARRTPGYITGRLRVEPGRVFWTITVWESPKAMVAFRDSGAHRRLLPKLAGWATEAVFGAWASRGELPEWSEVSTRVRAQPSIPQLDRPSANHGEPSALTTARYGGDLPLPGPLRKARSTGERPPD